MPPPGRSCSDPDCTYGKDGECETCSYFDMLWRWFEDESRIGVEGMRPERSTGLTADDFKTMLDEHEASLLADIALQQPAAQPQAALSHPERE